MQYLFHTTSLGAAGGSRVITNLANYLNERGHKVTLILDKDRIAYPLNQGVSVLQLTSFSIRDITPKFKGDTGTYIDRVHKKTSKTKKKTKLRHKYVFINSINEWKKYLLKLFTFPSKYLVMKNLLKSINPDLVVSHNMYGFLEHYCYYKDENFVVCLHNSPNQVFIDRTVKSIVPLQLVFKDKICIGVSDGVTHEVNSLIKTISPKSRTIYNPLDIDEIKRLSEETIDDFYLENKYIVSVSALAPGKKIDRTIKAFKKSNINDLYLLIIGEGEEKESLRRLTYDLDISEKVIFLGYVENPIPYMKNAELLSFTSEYEGFGLVLVESLACGTPVISTDCNWGPSEILTGKLKPYLTDIYNSSEEETVSHLAKSMQSIMDNKPEIGYEHIEKFDRKHITKQWESLASHKNMTS